MASNYPYIRKHEAFEVLKWEELADANYSTISPLTNYHLFTSIVDALAERRFGS